MLALAGVAVGAIFGLTLTGAFASDASSDSPSSDSGTATSVPQPSLDPGEPAEGPGGAASTEGKVRPNPDAAKLKTEVSRGHDHTKNGAVASFASYSVWLIASPAAKTEPKLAVEHFGGSLLNPADAEMLVGMKRAADDSFDVSNGAYRVLGFSGPESNPDQVMIEIVAPLSVGGNARWSVVGGVVKWANGSWELSSIAPREVPQPKSAKSIEGMANAERSKVAEGLGWLTFAPVN